MATSFGKDCREKEFMLKKDVVFANHGSYGTVPRRVRQAQMSYQQEMEQHPDNWFRFKNAEYWCRNLRCVAEFVGSCVENLTFVENATAGINAVLRSVIFHPNDVILVHSWTYNAIMQATKFTSDRNAAIIKLIDVSFPESKERLVKLYLDALDKTPEIRLVVLDSIASSTAVRFPVKEIVEICKARGVLILVDAAHAPIRGTRDSTAYHTCVDSIRFYEEMGGYDAIYAYNTALLNRAVDHLSQKWGTSPAPVPPECRAPFMQLVRLPEMKAYPKTADGATALMFDFLVSQGIVAAILCIDDEIWVRLSVQIYNTFSDYEKLGEAVMSSRSVDPIRVDLDNVAFDLDFQQRKYDVFS